MSSLHEFHFSSEAVTEGHLDKLCDRICDAVLEALLQQDAESRAQLDAVAKMGMVMLLGEVASKATVAYEQIIREAVKLVGYDQEEKGLDWRTMNVIVAVDSHDIVKPALEPGEDQAIVSAYASDETDDMMPLTQQLAEQLSVQMDRSRKDGTLSWLCPDARVQVSVKYEVDAQTQALVPKGVTSIAIVYRHLSDVKPADAEKELQEKVVKAAISSRWLESTMVDYTFTLRPGTGWGGASGASGASGRRHQLESYGGWVSPGPAPNGRDGRSLRRCGGLAARWAARTLVAEKMCRRCTVQLRYITAVPRVHVNSHGSGDDSKLQEMLMRNFDFRPQSLHRDLLKSWKPLTAGNAATQPWEKPKVLQ